MRAALGAVLISTFLSNSVTHAAGLIAWVPDVQTARRLAAEQNRLVLLHFWAPDCMPCKEVERTVFSSPVVAETLRQDFVAVKVNAYDAPALRMEYKVDRWPTDVVTTPNGEVIHSMVSSQDPREYASLLGAIARSKNSRPQQQTPWNRGPFEGSWPGPEGSQAMTNVHAQRQPTPSHPDHSMSGTGGGQGEIINHYVTRSQPTGQATGREFHPGQPIPGDLGETVDNRFAAEPPPSRDDRVSRWGGGPGSQVSNPYAVMPTDTGRQVAQREPASPDGSHVTEAPPQQEVGSPNRPGTGPEVASEALSGHCPVTLCRQRIWRKGDVRWGAVHRGRTYLFAGPTEQQQFLTDPDLYSPVLSGIDPVTLAEHGNIVQGKRQHGVVYREQIYLFESEDSLNRFWSAPERYAEPVRQAMKSGNLQQLLR